VGGGSKAYSVSSRHLAIAQQLQTPPAKDTKTPLEHPEYHIVKQEEKAEHKNRETDHKERKEWERLYSLQQNSKKSSENSHENHERKNCDWHTMFHFWPAVSP
jgi:hypothetical protein